MASVNKVILVGNLGADPETRYIPNGDAVAKLAEIVGQYLKKGSAVYVEGRIRTRKWQDKEGQERYTTEIEANEMQMLGGRQSAASSSGGEAEFGGSMPSAGASGSARAAPAKKTPSFEDMDDDIPF